MPDIKRRRLANRISCQAELCVGDCVPFYFSPRSIMLYVLHKANHPSLTYCDGQEPIVHLEADLRETVDWADENGKRWAFTPTNAGSRHFEDRCEWANLDEIDWEAVESRNWATCKEGKQAEFLVEHSFPWSLVQRIGVSTAEMRRNVCYAMSRAMHRPIVEVKQQWYY